MRREVIKKRFSSTKDCATNQLSITTFFCSKKIQSTSIQPEKSITSIHGSNEDTVLVVGQKNGASQQEAATASTSSTTGIRKIQASLQSSPEATSSINHASTSGQYQ